MDPQTKGEYTDGRKRRTSKKYKPYDKKKEERKREYLEREKEESSESDYEIDKELDERLKIEEQIYIAKAIARKNKLQMNLKKKGNQTKSDKDLLHMHQLMHSKSYNKEEISKVLHLPEFKSDTQLFIITDLFTKKKDTKYVQEFLLNLKKELPKTSCDLIGKISAYYNKTYPKKMLQDDLETTDENLNLLFSILYSLYRLNPELLKLVGKFLK